MRVAATFVLLAVAAPGESPPDQPRIADLVCRASS